MIQFNTLAKSKNLLCLFDAYVERVAHSGALARPRSTLEEGCKTVFLVAVPHINNPDFDALPGMQGTKAPQRRVMGILSGREMSIRLSRNGPL